MATEGLFGADAPAGFDELAARLRERRAAAGSPSFSEITRRVGAQRAERGVRPSERTPGRVTVYDCFREGRRRLDVELVLDIVQALGADAAEIARWRAWCSLLQRVPEAAALVPARLDLPPLVEPFVGRVEELRMLAAARGPVLVTGMAGAGKTQLAVRALRRLLAEGVVDGVVAVDARASTSGVAAADGSAIAEAIGRALGMGADVLTGAEAQAARVGRIAGVLAERRVAVLVDDLVDIAQVSVLAASVATPLVLVSRSLLAVPAGVVAVELRPWAPDEGLELLGALAGPERVAAEPDAARDIVELTGGLPLASALMGARVAERPGWSLADHRDALRARLDGLRIDRAVSESFALSYLALDPAARRALRLLSVQPCDALELSAFARLLDLDPAEAAGIRDALIAGHCAERAGGGRIGVHALVRAFATAQSWEEDPQPERDDALVRLAEERVARCWAAVTALVPGHLGARVATGPTPPVPAEDEARTWLVGELSGTIELGYAIAGAQPGLFAELAQALGVYLERQSLLRIAVRVHETAIECAERAGDEGALAAAHLLHGQVLLRLGDSRARGELERAVGLGQRAGRMRVAVSAANSLAIVAAHAGETDAAVRRFREAREAARDAVPDLYAIATDNLAIMMRRVGELDEALELHLEAYTYSTARGDTHHAAAVIGNASEVQLMLGDVDAAVESARLGVDLVAGRADVAYGHNVALLGMALLACGELDEARSRQLEALEMADRIEDAVLGALARNNLGFVEQERDPGAARRWFEEALALALRFELAFEAGRARLGLAELACAAGDRAAALAALDEADAVFEPFTPEGARATGLRALLGDAVA